MVLLRVVSLAMELCACCMHPQARNAPFVQVGVVDKDQAVLLTCICKSLGWEWRLSSTYRANSVQGEGD